MGYSVTQQALLELVEEYKARVKAIQDVLEILRKVKTE